MNPTYCIRDWNLHFEKAQSRKVEHTKWVAVPNKHDGKGFRRVMREPDGVAVYGAWNLMLQVASKCPKRGTLADEDGPLTALDLELKTGCPEAAFARAFTVLCEVGWLLVDDREPTGSGSPLVERSQPAPSALLGTANALELQDRTLQDKTTSRANARGGSKPKSKALPNGGSVWGAWVDANRAVGRVDPARLGPDLKASSALAGVLPADQIPDILRKYLADDDSFVARQGHALRLLPRRLDAYRNGTANTAGSDGWTPRRTLTPLEERLAFGGDS
ncbi:MAG: hypothetical protein HS116_19215 [Planctomycetes bacterium]|nr:hypothetical protein [Planctomycetota bacterium]